MQVKVLIPPKRLRWIPALYRLPHEYCFFLHDQCVHVLAEYEKARANFICFTFRDLAEKQHFERLAGETDTVTALREVGRPAEARRVIINTITLAMASDCLHHIYEALRCMEKRKFVVGLNLLRKPLNDSLAYLSWIVGDENDFYTDFSHSSPHSLEASSVGKKRGEIIEKAIHKTPLIGIIDAEYVKSTLFDKKNSTGLYGLMQHAVHLVTTFTPEYATKPENFNFIFKSHAEDDIYARTYLHLPSILLYMSHIIIELFDRMRPMDAGAKAAFELRTIGAYALIMRREESSQVLASVSRVSKLLKCDYCECRPEFDHINGIRALISDSFKCDKCKRISHFPFSYAF